MRRLSSFLASALAVVLVPTALGCSGSAHEAAAGPTVTPPEPSVVAISVDGLNVEAINRLGTSGAPTFHRMIDEGATTLNARTEVEQTVTLPNHTSMMTGRRINAARGGHGVTWDDDRPGTTVQRAAGHPVGSVFSRVHDAGGTTALYSTKAKFSLYKRSWPKGIETFRVKENQRRLVALARADLSDGAPTFTFLHVSLPDRYGHAYGGMSDKYLDAVRRTDAQLGTILRAVEGEDVVVILTADHGFASGEKDHSASRNPENFRIPFLVWGSGVTHGDLYELNPSFKNPGAARPSYARRQPVRNGNVANLALELLGLGSIPGSGIDAEQELTVD